MHTTAQLDNLELDESPAQAQLQAPKRSSSMIFRIEQLLPGSTSITTTATSVSASVSSTTVTMETSSSRDVAAKRMRTNFRPGVYTAQYTPKDTCSSAVPTTALLSCMATPTASDAHAHCRLVNGELAMSAALLRQIKLSEDIYSFNALFELQAGQLRIRLVRDVARDDEIVAWFGEELVLLMGIPFLTPLNIQGNNRYTCHLCHLTFETPHPLKIHLALSCGRNVMDLLWMRLHYALKSVTRTAATALPLSPPPATSTSTSSASPTRTPPPPQSQPAVAPTRFSAFRPMTAMHSLGLPMATAPSSPAALSYLPSISMAAPLTAHPLNAAAQIEAIVSNMGASKQGHLCIYCGKVYSRKYGLKIHIRTHTGFKPLKCKFCLRPFGDPSNLNKHVRLHLQTQPSSGSDIDINVDGDSDAEPGYQCQLCHKPFARARDLQRHMETRHGASATHVPPTTSTAATTTATGTALPNQS